MSDFTPYYFFGFRGQLFLTRRAKLELWLVNGWQTFGQWHEGKSGGYLWNWRPNAWLSLVNVGQPFLSFQWDIMLCEAALLSIPYALRPKFDPQLWQRLFPNAEISMVPDYRTPPDFSKVDACRRLFEDEGLRGLDVAGNLFIRSPRSQARRIA